MEAGSIHGRCVLAEMDERIPAFSATQAEMA